MIKRRSTVTTPQWTTEIKAGWQEVRARVLSDATYAVMFTPAWLDAAKGLVASRRASLCRLRKTESISTVS